MSPNKASASHQQQQLRQINLEEFMIVIVQVCLNEKSFDRLTAQNVFYLLGCFHQLRCYAKNSLSYQTCYVRRERRYCATLRVCVRPPRNLYHTLTARHIIVSAAKVMRCIQCSL